jgi:quinolinate synthase
MKMVTLENILSTLENESPEVTIDEPTRKAAEQSILNMVSIK